MKVKALGKQFSPGDPVKQQSKCCGRVGKKIGDNVTILYCPQNGRNVKFIEVVNHDTGEVLEVTL